MKDKINELVFIGGIMPERLLVGKLGEACLAWMDKPDGDNKQMIMALCLMVMSQSAADVHKEGVNGLLKHLEQEDQFRQMINPDRNKC